MPLRIELAPEELLFVGNTLIQGGRRRSEFLVLGTDAKILRGRNIITEDQADTPCKQMYLTLEKAYLADNPLHHETRFTEQAQELMVADPQAAPILAKIYGQILKGDHYKALMCCKDLVAYEAGHLSAADAATEGGPRKAGASQQPSSPAEAA